MGVVEKASGKSGEKSKSCSCHDQLDKRVRIDTGAKVVVPEHLPVIDAFMAFTAAFALPQAGQMRATPRHDRGAGPPRAAALTLFEQRCLLLV